MSVSLILEAQIPHLMMCRAKTSSYEHQTPACNKPCQPITPTGIDDQCAANYASRSRLPRRQAKLPSGRLGVRPVFFHTCSPVEALSIRPTHLLSHCADYLISRSTSSTERQNQMQCCAAFEGVVGCCFLVDPVTRTWRLLATHSLWRWSLSLSLSGSLRQVGVMVSAKNAHLLSSVDQTLLYRRDALLLFYLLLDLGHLVVVLDVQLDLLAREGPNSIFRKEGDCVSRLSMPEKRGVAQTAQARSWQMCSNGMGLLNEHGDGAARWVWVRKWEGMPKDRSDKKARGPKVYSWNLHRVVCWVGKWSCQSWRLASHRKYLEPWRGGGVRHIRYQVAHQGSSKQWSV